MSTQDGEPQPEMDTNMELIESHDEKIIIQQGVLEFNLRHMKCNRKILRET